MISLICAFAVLLLGYLVYGRLIEKTIEPDDRTTPAYTKEDGVDFVPMKTWKAFLVQLLNIAGTGPIFGALMGACFGPVVFLWIVFGAILGGAVHDFMIGMISERHDGASIAELSGIYLGNVVKWIMRIFSILLLLLTGTVFVTSPAGLLSMLTPDFMDKQVWIVIILAYYVLATLLPIDKIIGRLYPVFGAVLILMAIGILCGTIFGGYSVPEINFTNLHPEGLPVWPYMFVTVACGAISGFHATQSPMIAKCITSEKVGRKVFYGAMISESVIALVWAAGGVAFYGATGGLFDALAEQGQSGTVYDIAHGMLGGFGRYSLPFREAYSCRDVPYGSEEAEKSYDRYPAAAGSRSYSYSDRLQCPLEIFFMEQPDSGDGCFMDRNRLYAQVEEDQDLISGYGSTGYLYDSREPDLYPDGEGRIWHQSGNSLSHRNPLCIAAFCWIHNDGTQVEKKRRTGVDHSIKR